MGTVETTGSSESPRPCLWVMFLVTSPFVSGSASCAPWSVMLCPTAFPRVMFYLNTDDHGVKSPKPWTNQIFFLLNCCCQTPSLIREMLTNSLHVSDNLTLPARKELPHPLNLISSRKSLLSFFYCYKNLIKLLDASSGICQCYLVVVPLKVLLQCCVVNWEILFSL